MAKSKFWCRVESITDDHGSKWTTLGDQLGGSKNRELTVIGHCGRSGADILYNTDCLRQFPFSIVRFDVKNCPVRLNIVHFRAIVRFVTFYLLPWYFDSNWIFFNNWHQNFFFLPWILNKVNCLIVLALFIEFCWIVYIR